MDKLRELLQPAAKKAKFAFKHQRTTSFKADSSINEDAAEDLDFERNNAKAASSRKKP